MPTINDFHNFATAATRPGGLGETACAKISDDRAHPVTGQQKQSLIHRTVLFNSENMAARRDFLNAIKSAFGVSNIHQIPKKVLEVLKLEDFALDDHGHVTSEKPLTARRILQVTTRINALATLGLRVAEFRQAMAPVLNRGCARDFVALIKKGEIASARAIVDFVTRHFDKVSDKLAKVMVASADDRAAFCDAIAEDLLTAVGTEVVQAKLTREHLLPVSQALRAFAAHAAGAQTLWTDLARTFVTKLDAAAQEIAEASFGARTDAMSERANAVRERDLNGTFDRRIRSNHGRDILLRRALDGLNEIDELGDAERQAVNGLLLDLARHTAEMGRERTFLWIRRLRNVMTGGEDGVNRMMVRQVLGEALKGYTSLTDADLKELSTTLLFDYALAGANDALAEDRAQLTKFAKDKAAEAIRQHYTSAETREMMALANQPAPEAPVQIPVAPPLPVPGHEKESIEAFRANKAVCDSLNLLGKLLHREDGWKADDDPAATVRDTLTRNADLVRALVDNWNNGKINLEGFSTTVAVALAWVFPTDVPFHGAIKEINLAVKAFAEAATDEARQAASETIVQKLNLFAGGLSKGLSQMMATNLRPIMDGAGLGGNFPDLPDGVDPAHADLFRLACDKHKPPRNETTAQRQAREAAILADYSKLVVDPEAGGLGTLINELLSHYVDALDVHEQRAMLSGALLAIDPTMITNLLGGHSALELINKATPQFLGGEGRMDEVKTIVAALLPKDVKSLTPAQRGAAGKVAGAILKNAGPVLQKMVQMIGVQNMPVFLQDAIRDCKSNLKPIPLEYVRAKLDEVVRRSDGKIRSLELVESKGAASIAQVFNCRLTDERGQVRNVVIKIMRPDVRGRMEREIAAIRKSVAGAGEGALRTLNARINSLLEELDFTVERANISECQPIYGHSPYTSLRSVKLAEGCPQLSDVLVMEEAPGKNFQEYMDETTTQLDALLAEGHVEQDENGHYRFQAVDPETHRRLDTELRRMYQDVLKRQTNLQLLVKVWFSNALFDTGKFHGDLHGGNIMVDNDGKLTVIDFGNAPTFSKEDRKSIVKLFVSALRGKPGNLLDALKDLVSPASREVLADRRADLVLKLQRMFAASSIENAADRLTIVFGELARAGVEVPESLYNFTEAFGRLQQLSASMERTLTRISGALPYLREHENDERFPAERLYSVGADDIVYYQRTVDEILDGMLQSTIDHHREDVPGITDPEIFAKIADAIEEGSFQQRFASYGSNNPVVSHTTTLLGRSLSNGTLIKTLDKLHPELFKPLEDNPNVRQPDFDNPATAAAIAEIAKQHVELILRPFVRKNARLAPLLARLQDVLGRIFSADNIVRRLHAEFDLSMTPELLSGEEDDGIVFNAEANFAAKAEGGRLTEQQARMVADLQAEYSNLLRNEIVPELARVYNDRLNALKDSFRLNGFLAPVPVQQTMRSSATKHWFKSLCLGGAGAIALGVNCFWNAVFGKNPPKIRANFNARLDSFRTFAAGEGGRIHATEAKRLEATEAIDKATVHNAEARRALVEALIADLHVTPEAFYESPEGRKVASLLGLDPGETMNDVESAMALTPALIRQVLAVHDMAKLNRAPVALRAMKAFFYDRPSLEDVTLEDFNLQLARSFASLRRGPASLARTLGLEEARLENFVRSHYGQVLARMSEIVAADPTAVRLGTTPTAQLQRALVAALVETVRDERSLGRQNLALADVFGEKVNRGAAGVDALRLGADSPLATALRLHALESEESVRTEVAFIGTLRQEFTPQLFGKAPSEEEADDDASNRAQALLLPHEGAEFTDRERAVMDAADRIGFGLYPIAADANLYAQYKADPQSSAVRNAIATRVRRVVYARPQKVPLDPERETQKILDYFAAKYDAEPKNFFQRAWGGFQWMLGGFED